MDWVSIVAACIPASTSPSNCPLEVEVSAEGDMLQVRFPGINEATIASVFFARDTGQGAFEALNCRAFGSTANCGTVNPDCSIQPLFTIKAYLNAEGGVFARFPRDELSQRSYGPFPVQALVQLPDGRFAKSRVLDTRLVPEVASATFSQPQSSLYTRWYSGPRNGLEALLDAIYDC